ncbi:c-type cytochrome [Rhodoferax sp.]|uniref:c-type cytochrome n=1 Tax=Rhodoferax sp. TaxID=50421 RepID=UPI0027506916|nr:c-type cytochrome [Rhodoferax sp.]
MKHLRLALACTLFAGPVLAAESRTTELVNGRCATCHGAEGQSTSPIFPSLAAQNREYLVKQLQDFKSKKRVSETMAPQVADLSEENIAALASFFSAKPARTNRVSDADLLPVGRYIYSKGNSWSGVPACVTCHGEKAYGTASLPRLAGQSARYLLTQLKDFNQRTRTNDNEAMHLVASRLTEMETKAVADYLSQLP